MARSGEAEIKRILGEKTGHQLYRYANGIDDSPVRAEREEAKGYSAETTVEEDLVTYEQALALLLAQCDGCKDAQGREKVQLCGGDLSDTGF